MRTAGGIIIGIVIIGALGWLGMAAHQQANSFTWLFGTTLGFGPFALAALTLAFAGLNALASQKQARVATDQLKIANANALLAQKQVQGAIEASSEQIRLGKQSLEHAANVLAQSVDAEVAARFQRAAELLNSAEPAARVGAVMLLQEIGTSTPARYYNVVLNLLIVFAEQHTADAWSAVESLRRLPPDEQERPNTRWNEAFAQTPDDVIAAVRAIGVIRQYPKWEEEEAKWLGGLWLRLRRVTLVDQTIVGGNFSRMMIDKGFLSNVTFTKCRFEGTVLNNATTINVHFQDCNLRDTTLKTEDAIATPDDADRKLRFTHKTDLRDATIRTKQEMVVARDYTTYLNDDEHIFGASFADTFHDLKRAIPDGIRLVRAAAPVEPYYDDEP